MRRGGFTLVEILVAGGLVVLVLVFFFSTTRTGALTEKLGSSKLENLYEFSRLVYALRRDMACSKKARAAGDLMELELGSGKTVLYQKVLKNQGSRKLLSVDRQGDGKNQVYFRFLVEADLTFTEVAMPAFKTRKVVRVDLVPGGTSDTRKFQYNPYPPYKTIGGLNATP